MLSCYFLFDDLSDPSQCQRVLELTDVFPLFVNRSQKVTKVVYNTIHESPYNIVN